MPEGHRLLVAWHRICSMQPRSRTSLHARFPRSNLAMPIRPTTAILPFGYLAVLDSGLLRSNFLSVKHGQDGDRSRCRPQKTYKRLHSKDADGTHCTIATRPVDSTMSATPNVDNSGSGLLGTLSRFFNAVCDASSRMYNTLRAHVVSAWNTARNFGESRKQPLLVRST